MTQEFKHLFSPIKIGPMTVRNRIVSSAHVPAYDITRLINYWVAKAKGGVGLIESQITVVHPRAEQNMFNMPGIVDAFKTAANAVHEHGAKFIIQMGNLAAQSGAYARPTPWAPSAVLTINQLWEQHVPHAMTRDEIKGFVEAFAHGASVAKEAGVAAGALQTGEELLEYDPQLKHRGFFRELEHPEIGRYHSAAPAFLLSKSPYELQRAPLIGEHNEYVLKDILGMSDEEIAELVIVGVIE